MSYLVLRQFESVLVVSVCVVSYLALHWFESVLVESVCTESYLACAGLRVCWW